MRKIINATLSNLDEILNIYNEARIFMKNTGNPDQWKDNKPDENTLINDIKNKNLYIILDDDIIVASFALIEGIEKTYINIYDGAWLSNDKYITIHRVAKKITAKNIMDSIVKFAETKKLNLRIDTHIDNKIMQHLILKNGFVKCGIIYLEDKSLRIAYEKII